MFATSVIGYETLNDCFFRRKKHFPFSLMVLHTRIWSKLKCEKQNNHIEDYLYVIDVCYWLNVFMQENLCIFLLQKNAGESTQKRSINSRVSELWHILCFIKAQFALACSHCVSTIEPLLKNCCSDNLYSNSISYKKIWSAQCT